ncbi:MAG: hypothetical protein HYV67_01585 [Candidatus Taylorbacteria bacterium]|nr:hypothetical protein [Candidatus Taylorbacteria bacterium]
MDKVFKGEEVALKLLAINKLAVCPLLRLFSASGAFENFQFEPGALEVCNLLYSVPDLSALDPTSMFAPPSKMILTTEPYKISFAARQAATGLILRFVWLKEGKGLPVDEILLVGLGVGDG